jgi:hypothetical protein
VVIATRTVDPEDPVREEPVTVTGWLQLPQHRLRATGHDVTMIEYEGAHHGFDSVSAGAPRRVPGVLNLAHCIFLQVPGGGFVTTDGRPAGRDAPCITRGATVGYDAGSHRRPIAAVEAFLARVFSRPST